MTKESIKAAQAVVKNIDEFVAEWGEAEKASAESEALKALFSIGYRIDEFRANCLTTGTNTEKAWDLFDKISELCEAAIAKAAGQEGEG